MESTSKSQGRRQSKQQVEVDAIQSQVDLQKVN
jgi:hypothetical protein